MGAGRLSQVQADDHRRRVGFSSTSDTGRWRGTPLEQVAGLLTETAQQHVLGLVADAALSAVLASGVAEIRDRIVSGLTADTRLAETGIADPQRRDVAAQARTSKPHLQREAIQQEADRSTYERRAVAVERRRGAIAENELQSKIEARPP